MNTPASLKEPVSSTNISRGIGFTLLSILLFGMQDASAKILVQDYPVAQIVMLRFWAFGVFAIFLAVRQHGFLRVFHTKTLGLQIFRGLVFLADLLLFALGLRTLPLAEAAAITLTFPIFVTLIAIPLLGENVGRFRWISIFLGFAGVLIILRPGFGVFDVGALYALGATLLFALYVVLTRIVAQGDSTATCMLFAGLTGMIGSSIIGLFYWQPLSFDAWGIVAILMTSTTGANYFVMRALANAPASAVQPFNYMLLPWAILLNFVVFGSLIDVISLIGAIIIVGSGLMVWFRERRVSVSD